MSSRDHSSGATEKAVPFSHTNSLFGTDLGRDS
jgi:hypothetical protein